MKEYRKEDTFLQIDVKSVNKETIICNMYTGVLCCEIRMKREDYEYLLGKGFFTAAGTGGKTDSAGIISTTEVYRIPSLTVTG